MENTPNEKKIKYIISESGELTIPPDERAADGGPEAGAGHQPQPPLEAPAVPPVPEEREGQDFPDSEEPEEPPRVRQGAGCLSIISYVALIIGFSILLAAFLIIAANDMFAFVKSDKEALVVIEEGETLKEISVELKEAGIIRYPFMFRFFANMSKMAEKIAPGEYELNAKMDYRTILTAVRKKAEGPVVLRVTIPEGMTQKDIFELLESEGVCEAWRLRGAAQYYDYNYSFLQGLDYTPERLEGYLFPDTYEFYENEDPIRVIRKFLSNFNRKITVDMKARAGNINMSIRDIIIIASMIEREAKFDDERPTISSVIHNRLQNSSQYPRLEIDATVQYALPYHKEVLTEEDLKIDSPYNTYIVKGLPAGPISNPGLAAIRAALYPEDTGFFYYNARKNGWHYFSKTLTEHNANIKKARDESIEEPSSPAAAGNIDG